MAGIFRINRQKREREWEKKKTFRPKTDIVTAPKYFSSLVLYFFNPTTADDLELRQCLSVFFPAFAFGNFKAHSAVIESAFVPTLKTVSTVNCCY